VCLAESSFHRELGFDIAADKKIRKDAFLFGESQGRVVLSVKKENEIALVGLLKKQEVPFTKLGFVKGREMKIDGEVFGSISEFKQLYDTSIENILND
jgi:phosphoribosylformylglycinamidine synthase